MFDPVWFGNQIVPRWEALSMAAGGVVISMAAIVIVITGWWVILSIVDMMRAHD